MILGVFLILLVFANPMSSTSKSTNHAPFIQILRFKSYVLSKTVPQLTGRRVLSAQHQQSQASNYNGKGLFCKRTRDMRTGQIP